MYVCISICVYVCANVLVYVCVYLALVAVHARALAGAAGLEQLEVHGVHLGGAEFVHEDLVGLIGIIV
jgi:hypothetical protein